jgi:hypothetical protein
MARSNTVVAKEAIVITVGARAPEYEYVDVRHNRTGETVKMRKDVPFDEGDEGVPFAFKAGEKVPRSHDAVKACPGAFADEDDAA